MIGSSGEKFPPQLMAEHATMTNAFGQAENVQPLAKHNGLLKANAVGCPILLDMSPYY